MMALFNHVSEYEKPITQPMLLKSWQCTCKHYPNSNEPSLEEIGAVLSELCILHQSIIWPMYQAHELAHKGILANGENGELQV